MSLNPMIVVGSLMVVAGLSLLLGMFIGGRLGRAAVREADAAERCATTLEQPAVQIPQTPTHTHSRNWDETVTIGIPEHYQDRGRR